MVKRVVNLTGNSGVIMRLAGLSVGASYLLNVLLLDANHNGKVFLDNDLRTKVCEKQRITTATFYYHLKVLKERGIITELGGHGKYMINYKNLGVVAGSIVQQTVTA